jgi:hypothetical protein
MFRSVVGAYRSTIFPYSQILGYGQPNICEQGKIMERQPQPGCETLTYGVKVFKKQTALAYYA